MMELGKSLYIRRKSVRLRQGEVAKRAGIHLATLLDFERGKAGPDDATYQHICEVIRTLSQEATSAAPVAA